MFSAAAAIYFFRRGSLNGKSAGFAATRASERGTRPWHVSCSAACMKPMPPYSWVPPEPDPHHAPPQRFPPPPRPPAEVPPPQEPSPDVEQPPPKPVDPQ
jgi:hypothetical protein